MNHIKVLGLLVVGVAILMAFAGPATATTITSPTGTTYTGQIKAVAGPSSFTGSFVKVECASSTLEGNIEGHGAGVTASGKLNSLTFSECNYNVTVLKPGLLELHAISGSESSTAKWTGAEFTMHTSVGQCIFTTNETHLGTMTAGANARLDVFSTKIPRTGGSFLCGSSNTWVTEGYTFNTPSSFYVD